MKPWWDILGITEWFNESLHPELEDMAFVYSPHYNMKLLGHVFPAVKFSRIFELLSWDEYLSKLNVYYPEKASLEDLLLVHTQDYLDDLFHLRSTKATAYSELPLNSEIVEAFLYAVGGTILATELTEKYDFVFNVGGGFHHSFPEHAEGFCYLNDVGVAAKKYLKQNPHHKILIIDLDVHQGNGNAVVFQNEPRVFTFSIHQENLYPLKQKSSLDVGLSDGCRDSEYLEKLQSSLQTIEKNFKPNLIYYIAGVDPYEQDLLGGLKLTKSGLGKRDLMVKKFAKSLGAKTVILTAGGYSQKTEDTVSLHIQTAQIFSRKEYGFL